MVRNGKNQSIEVALSRIQCRIFKASLPNAHTLPTPKGRSLSPSENRFTSCGSKSQETQEHLIRRPPNANVTHARERGPRERSIGEQPDWDIDLSSWSQIVGLAALIGC